MKADIVLIIRNSSLRGREVNALRSQLRSMVAPGRRLVLQMAGVETVDSHGAGAILEFARKLQSTGGSLLLVGLQKNVTAFFEMLQLHRVVEICASPAEVFAVESAA